MSEQRRVDTTGKGKKGDSVRFRVYQGDWLTRDWLWQSFDVGDTENEKNIERRRYDIATGFILIYVSVLVEFSPQRAAHSGLKIGKEIGTKAYWTITLSHRRIRTIVQRTISHLTMKNSVVRWTSVVHHVVHRSVRDRDHRCPLLVIHPLTPASTQHSLMISGERKDCISLTLANGGRGYFHNLYRDTYK